MNSDRPNKPLGLPLAVLAELEAAAGEDQRPISDLLRDLVESGLEERRRKIVAGKDRQRSFEAALFDDMLPITDAYHQRLREKIAEGVRSFREGDIAGGETFMAAIDAELAALERQGH